MLSIEENGRPQNRNVRECEVSNNSTKHDVYDIECSCLGKLRAKKNVKERDAINEHTIPKGQCVPKVN